MGKKVWKGGTVLYPLPAVMVSCSDKEGNNNIITIAWTGIINTDPPMTYISVRPNRYSHSIIEKSGEFVINLTNEKLFYACDYCGVKSGRDINKFEAMKLTPEKASQLIYAPIIYESPVNIECKVKNISKLGSHDMFTAEILAVNVSDEYLDENGKFHFDKTNPICYSHGQYYSLGKKLGHFGSSVKKTKKKNHK